MTNRWERERETLDHSFCDQSKAEAFKGKSPKAAQRNISGWFDQVFVSSECVGWNAAQGRPMAKSYDFLLSVV